MSFRGMTNLPFRHFMIPALFENAGERQVGFALAAGKPQRQDFEVGGRNRLKLGRFFAEGKVFYAKLPSEGKSDCVLHESRPYQRMRLRRFTPQESRWTFPA